MRRFFAPPEIAAGDEFELPEAEAHHAIRVIRCREGEQIQVLDGAGSSLVCEIVSVTRSNLGVRVLQRSIQARPPRELTLAQGILKGKAMDLVVEKATELGVTQIIPIISANSVAIPDHDKRAGKVEKWQSTALTAIKQCGRAWLPKIAAPVAIGDVVEGETDHQEIIASLRGEVDPLTEIAAKLARDRPVRVWIGPEGDFTEAEYARLDQAGGRSVSLSDAVLRSETAAICALSCLQLSQARR